LQLLQDLERLRAAIAEERARLDAQLRAKQEAELLAELGGADGSSGGGGGGGGGAAGGLGGGGGDEDALDAFMSGVETQMEKDKVRLVSGEGWWWGGVLGIGCGAVQWDGRV